MLVVAARSDCSPEAVAHAAARSASLAACMLRREMRFGPHRLRVVVRYQPRLVRVLGETRRWRLPHSALPRPGDTRRCFLYSVKYFARGVHSVHGGGVEWGSVVVPVDHRGRPAFTASAKITASAKMTITSSTSLLSAHRVAKAGRLAKVGRRSPPYLHGTHCRNPTDRPLHR